MKILMISHVIQEMEWPWTWIRRNQTMLCRYNPYPSPWIFQSIPETTAYSQAHISKNQSRIKEECNKFKFVGLWSHLQNHPAPASQIQQSNKFSQIRSPSNKERKMHTRASTWETHSTKLSKLSSIFLPLPSSYLEIRTWRTEDGVASPMP